MFFFIGVVFGTDDDDDDDLEDNKEGWVLLLPVGLASFFSPPFGLPVFRMIALPAGVSGDAMEEGVEAVAFGPTVIADAEDSPVIESS